MNWLASNSFWMSLTGAFVFGGALFSWIYAIMISHTQEKELKAAQGRLETAVAEATATKVDRIRLADEAENIATEITAIYGQYVNRSSAESRLNMSADDMEASWARENVSESTALEKYHVSCHVRAWATIEASTQVLKLNVSDSWHLSQGVSGLRQLTAMTQLLAKIAARLRYDGEPIPMVGSFEERQLINSQLPHTNSL